MSNKVLVFGYGSLINTRSRRRTARDCGCWRADLTGYSRGWEVVSFRETFLGISSNVDGVVNGVLFKMPGAQLKQLDRREYHYNRVRVHPSQVRLAQDAPLNLPIYTYVTRNPQVATAARPVTKSYVQICLSGCAEWEPGMADEFIRTTRYWPAYKDQLLS